MNNNRQHQDQPEPRPVTTRQLQSLAVCVCTLTAGVAAAVVGGERLGLAMFLFVAGLTAIVVASLGLLAWFGWRMFSARYRPADEAFAEGLAVGRNRGYKEGRAVGRPVNVPMRCPHCGEGLGKKKTG